MTDPQSKAPQRERELDSRLQNFCKSGISTIGEDLLITGHILSKGEIQLHGKIHGDVQCRSLVLGSEGELTGNVVAEEVELKGRLVGSVRALRVTLRGTCHIEGDLEHQSLTIQQGAYFEGKSRHFDGPLLTDQAKAGDEVVAKP